MSDFPMSDLSKLRALSYELCAFTHRWLLTIYYSWSA